MVRLHTLGSIGLHDDEGHDFGSVIAQPRKLAILTVLATSPHGHRDREQLLHLFWPDRIAPLAHAALCQAIHFPRRELGAQAIGSIGSRTLAIDDAFVNCDAVEFARACPARDFERALQIYQGDFLDGLFIAEPPGRFDDWRERECSRLRQLALDATAALIALHRRAGDPGVAIYWARRALAIQPDNEPMLRECVTLLSDTGDRASALRAYEVFRAHLGREVGAMPSATTELLMSAIRREARPEHVHH